MLGCAPKGQATIDGGPSSPHRGPVLFLYAFINLLFVLKYSARVGIDGGVAGASYLAAVALLAWARRRVAAWAFARRLSAPAYWAAVTLVALTLLALMRQFDPAAIRVTRYVAIHDWLTQLLHGDFPYASTVNPSAFPFLFACALPFYLAGDLGLLQIAAFFGFAWVCLRASRGSRPLALGSVLLLAVSPLFLFEVVVRSELTTNMILVLLLLSRVELLTGDEVGGRAGASGPGAHPRGLEAVAAGLLLSTRGIVVLVYALAFTAVFRRRLAAGAGFALIAVLAFAATLVPFLWWDAGRFMSSGPFAIQLSYLPLPLVLAALAIAVAIGARTGTWRDLHRWVALLLFAVVAAPFSFAVVTLGWQRVLGGDRFDISYFAFAHAFAIGALARPAPDPAATPPGAATGGR